MAYDELSRFHKLGNRSIESEETEPDAWPASWSDVEYKRYNRAGPEFSVPTRSEAHSKLSEIYEGRVSARKFEGAVHINNVLSALTICASDRHERERSRSYPSAGALFSLEVYLISYNIGGIGVGVYHFSPDQSHIRKILNLSKSNESFRCLSGQEFGTPSGAFVISSVLHRVTKKYGHRGYRFALQEAGCLCGFLNLALSEVGVSSCWVGGFNDDLVSDCVGISLELENEVPVMLLPFGLSAA